MRLLERKSTAPIRLSPALHVEVKNAESGYIEGYASTFNDLPDSYGDVVAPGAFSRSLTEHKGFGTAPIMLWAHDQSRVIGRWNEVKEDDRGLFVAGQLNIESSTGRDALAHVKAGDVSGLSIGFRTPEGGRVRRSDGTAILREVNLVEVSIVAVPASRRTRIDGIKSASDLVATLTDAGLSEDEAQRLADGGWRAVSNTEIQTRAAQLARLVAGATAQIRKIA